MEKTKKAKVEKPKVEEVVAPKVKKPQFVDKLYELTIGESPIVYILKSRGCLWFDPNKGYEREIKYCENQNTIFVDEMKGPEKLSHIMFRDGKLYVPKEKQTLQTYLAYHPDLNKKFKEHNPVQIAENDIDYLEMEINALNLAMDLDVDMAEAVMRVEIGSKVSEMSSKELKRDLLLYAKRNPELFLDLVNDDNIQLRNFGIKATELGIIKISQDQRHFEWGSTGRKLMTVPFDEHPYSALAQWFKTDEGMEVYTNIEKRLS